VSQPSPEIYAAALVDCDDVDIAKRRTALAEAIVHGLRWKPGPMLDPSKAFLFDGGEYLAIADERRRRVSVKCIESEY
jgi:hypothetical protein